MTLSDKSAPVAKAQPVRVKTRDGTSLVGGLEWTLATHAEFPVYNKNAPLVLRLPGFRAEVDRTGDQRDERSGSLLMALAAGLLHDKPDAIGTWIFLINIPKSKTESVFMLAMADLSRPEQDDNEDAKDDQDISVIEKVIPRAGLESIFDAPEDVLAALEAHIVTTEIAGLAICWANKANPDCQNMIALLDSDIPDVSRYDVSPRSADLPIFVAPRYIPKKWIGIGISGLAALLMIFFVVVPTVRSMLQPVFTPKPELMVNSVIKRGAFAENCIATLQTWLPRRSGWKVADRGCALAMNLPSTPVLPEPEIPSGLFTSMVVWTHLKRDSNRNLVFSRSTAQSLVNQWQYQSRIEENDLILWQEIPLPVVNAEAAGITVNQNDSIQIRNQLQRLWAKSPDSVRISGIGFTISPPLGTLIDEIFSYSVLNGIEPVRFIETRANQGVLELAPVTIKQMPESFFATEILE